MDGKVRIKDEKNFIDSVRRDTYVFQVRTQTEHRDGKE